MLELVNEGIERVAVTEPTMDRHAHRSGFQTEVEFTLPKGYVDDDGVLHRHGVMRLATAADEILPLRDPRVQQNPAYLTVIVLARVITRLGSLPTINTKVVEGLFASDLELPAARSTSGSTAAEEPQAIAVPARPNGRAATGLPRPWGKPEGLPRRPAVRGDGLHRLPLPLAQREADGPGARRAPPLVPGDLRDQPRCSTARRRRTRSRSL